MFLRLEELLCITLRIKRGEPSVYDVGLRTGGKQKSREKSRDQTTGSIR